MLRFIPVLLFAVLLLLLSGCMDSKNKSAASQTTRIVEAPLIESYPQSVSSDSVTINVRTLPNATVYVSESKNAVADESGAARLNLSLPDTINTFVIRAKSSDVFSQSNTIVITKGSLNNDGTTRLSLSYDMSDIAAQSPITNLVLNVDTTELLQGDITALEVIATLSDGSTLNVTDDVSWIVSNATQLSIASEKLQSVAEGIVIIQASYKEMLSKPVVLTLLKEINGHILPLMPDSVLNNATLEGIDANNNGIRDDVERWVLESYESYGCIATEISLKGANLAQLITTQAKNTADAKALFDQVMSRVLNFQTDCEINEEGLVKAMGLLDTAFNSLQFNTADRNEALMLFKSLWEQNTNTLSSQELLQQAQAYSQILIQQLIDKSVSEERAKVLAQKILTGFYGLMDKLGDASSSSIGQSSSVVSISSNSVSSMQSSSSVVSVSSSSVSSMQSSSSSASFMPSIIGSVDIPGNTHDITLSNDGTVAYVTGSSGLQIIDITNPALPVIIGSLDTLGSAKGITLSNDGTIAYVLAGGLQIIDVSNSSAPVIIGSADTSGSAYDFTLSNDGTLAYVADNFFNLKMQIIDVSNPSAPVTVSSVAIQNNDSDLLNATLSNDDTIVYIGQGYMNWGSTSSSLQIIDVRSPLSPVIIGSIDTSDYGWPVDITLSNDGTVAYVAHSYAYGVLQIIDVSNPSSPKELGSIYTSSYIPNVTLSNDSTVAYVTGSSGLQIIDITNPTVPVIIGSLDTLGSTNDITLSNDGTIAYVLAGGLQIIDVSGIKVLDKAPWINTTIFDVKQNSSIGDMIGTLNIAYTGSSGITELKLTGSGAEYFNVATDGTVTLAKMLDKSNKTYNLAAVATNSKGSRSSRVTIRVHSIPKFKTSNQTVYSMSPEGTLVGQIDMLLDNNETITAIALTGNGAEYFTIDTSGRIYVAPNQAKLHHYLTPSYQLGVSASNSYGTNTHAGTVKINVSKIITELPSALERPSPDGMLLYTVNDRELKTFDISDPQTPVVISTLEMPNSFNRMILSPDGNTIYGIIDNNISIINVSNPSAAVFVGNVNTPNLIKDIYIAPNNNTIYAVNGSHNLGYHVDIIDTTSVALIGSINISGSDASALKDIISFSSDSNTMYMIDASGLNVIDISNPSAAVIVKQIDLKSMGIYGAVYVSGDESLLYEISPMENYTFRIFDFNTKTLLSSLVLPTPYLTLNNYAFSQNQKKVFMRFSVDLMSHNFFTDNLLVVDFSNPFAPQITRSVYENDFWNFSPINLIYPRNNLNIDIWGGYLIDFTGI